MKKPAKDVKIDGRGKVELPRRPKGKCRWCGKRITKKRRRNWCSEECVKSFYAQGASGVKAQVRRRDKGICAICRSDTIKLKKNLPKTEPERSVYLEVCGIPKSRIHTRWFDIDHKKPVADGGKMTLSNLRTLCLRCHQAVTKEWMAKKRKQAPTKAGTRPSRQVPE